MTNKTLNLKDLIKKAIIEDSKYDEPIKAELWRNVDIAKDGKSYRNISTHPTEEAARKYTESADAKAEQMQRDIPGYQYTWKTLDGYLTYNELAYTIQMPIIK